MWLITLICISTKSSLKAINTNESILQDFAQDLCIHKSNFDLAKTPLSSHLDLTKLP